MGRWTSATLAVLALAVLPGPARAADPAYDLAGGCYALQSGHLEVARQGDRYVLVPDAGAETFRMQATDLGVYLLYARDRAFLAAGGEAADEPAPSAEWRVDARDGAHTLTNLATGEGLRADSAGNLDGGEPTLFEFVPAEGCAKYPELGTGTRGRPDVRSWHGPTRGLMDAHLHAMAFPYFGGAAHCGRPWHRYGAPYALRDCPDHEPNGEAAVAENTRGGTVPFAQHDTDGWPSFRGWPHHRTILHEQVYWKWLERAWLGGMRLFTNLYVDNAVLCDVYPIKTLPCDEMDNVRLQIRALHDFVDYIDAQYGGPGKGFLRIVKDPFEARRAINEGKLAVVQGIEISRLFDCRAINDVPQCTREDIDRQLEEVYDVGVRQVELLNKFDNALSGVAGDGGSEGVITNAGNRYETGHFFAMQTCHGHGEDDHDKPQNVFPTTGATDPFTGVTVQELIGHDTLPAYPPRPHCNVRGLTSLGAYLVRRLMERGMIFDPDHMSVLARSQALSILEARNYSGVVSSHSWSTPDAYRRIAALGGVNAPSAKGSEHFIRQWKEVKAFRDPRFHYGLGYSTDIQGFTGQAGPRKEGPEFRYPFKSVDGAVELRRQVSGEKRYHINQDGLAHVGLYPDLLEDIRIIGGREITRDLRQGPEAYLQMWERAVGVPFGRCQSDRETVTSNGRAGLRLGASAEQALERAGQPDRRSARRWAYCVRGKRNRGARVTATFTRDGRVALVSDTSGSARAAGIGRGDRASRLRGRSARGPRGTRVRRLPGGEAFVYGVRRGRVHFVAVASPEIAGSAKGLRRHLGRAGL